MSLRGMSEEQRAGLPWVDGSNLSPETRSIIARSIIAREKAIEPMMHTPEFELLGPPDGGVLAVLCFTRACTSLSDEEATARINLLPPMGDHGRWVLLTEPGNGGPVPCASRPDTHRHLMWEVYTDDAPVSTVDDDTYAEHLRLGRPQADGGE